MQFGTKASVYLAAGLAALGFFVIFLGWDGAAEKDFVAGQIPYVISGGFAGLGLVIAGVALALAEARRRDTARLTAKLDRLLEHLGAGEEGLASPAPARPVPPLRRPRPRRRSA